MTVPSVDTEGSGGYQSDEEQVGGVNIEGVVLY